MSKGVLIAAAVLCTVSPEVAPAQPVAEPIRIGIIDVQADRLSFKDARTSISYREFAPAEGESATWNTEANIDHGVGVASAFVRQVRRIDEHRPIEIFAANPMFELGGGKPMYKIDQERSPKIKINFEGAREALRWFKANNVKVVLTTMNGGNSAGMKSLVKEGLDLGLVIFASSGNNPATGPVFPAAYKEVISVVAAGKSVTNALPLSSWTKFSLDGNEPVGREGKIALSGSSFAVAKAAAFGAYAVATKQAGSTEEISAYISKLSASSPQTLGSATGMSFVDFRNAAMAAKRTSVAQQNASLSPSFHALAAAASGSMSR